MRLTLSLLTGLILMGCGTYAPLPVVDKKVDLNSYKGTWYEIARLPNSFEEGCSNVTANYTLQGQKILVKNTCSKNGKKNVANGVAYSINDDNSKLRVSFFRPFYGDYWILDLADDYSYVLVGEQKRKLLWILSRESTLGQTTKDALVAKAKSLGFQTDKFIWTQHD